MKPLLRFLLGATFLLPSAGAAPPANDVCAGAEIIPTLNTVVSGSTIDAANDYQLSGAACFGGISQMVSNAPGRDAVYSFKAPATSTYSFRVSDYNGSGDLVLYLASSCPGATPPTPVVVSTCLGAANRTFAVGALSSEEILCVSLTLGQSVFLFVDEHAATAGATFSIEVNACSKESEPNNTAATANALAEGTEGSINPNTDADFFALGTPAAGSRVFALIDGRAAGFPDFDLRVTTSTNTLEYDDADTDGIFGTLCPTVAGRALTGVPSYLRVSTFDYPPPVPAEPYRLYWVVQPASTAATLETEPNETRPTANAGATNYFSGALAGAAPSTDRDLFRFAAMAGDLIFLSLDADPLRNNTPINARLSLLDQSAVLVQVNDLNSSSNNTPGASLTSLTPSSPAESLVYRTLFPGTYYAAVEIGTAASDATGAGDYLLSIAIIPNVVPLTAIERNGHDIIVIFEALAGRRYRLERKLALSEPIWQTIAGLSDLTLPSSGAAQFTHPEGATRMAAFYRVHLLP